MKGVSLREQRKKVENVMKAGKMIINVAGKVKKSLAAREKRIWGGMDWMNDEDKKQADLVWSEKQKAKEEKKEVKNKEE